MAALLDGALGGVAGLGLTEWLRYTIASAVEATFSAQLKAHAEQEAASVRAIAIQADTLTGLSKRLMASDFSKHTAQFAEQVKKAIERALEISEVGPSRGYCLGLLTVLESAVRDLTQRGLHLSADIRTTLYRQVGASATESILRIEPMDLWPPASANANCWSESFDAVLRTLGALQVQGPRGPLKKMFVFLLRDNADSRHRSVLEKHVTNMGWTPYFCKMSDVASRLEGLNMGPFLHELEGHHLVVDTQIDLIADVFALRLSSARGGRSVTQAPSGLFDKVQPRLKAKFLEHDNEHQHTQQFVRAIAREISGQTGAFNAAPPLP
jgi:hypothetical protein